MSIKEVQVKDSKRSIKEKCVECLRGPNLVKTLVVFGCMAIVIEQITTSINKLVKTPITTYSHFDFNLTLLYPSVTLCREPAYKFNKLQDYNLYAHPQFTSSWRNFNFSNTNLAEVWDNITYNSEDYFVQYGLDGATSNVDLKEVMGFYYGRCYTLSPNIISTKATKETGYTITLQHTADDVSTNVGIDPAGYHVFIHYVREPFTEVAVHNGGLVEYLYVNTGETVNVKLKVKQYAKISEDGDPCSLDTSYSANECTTKQIWKMVEETAGCSGPWMESVMPRCDNYTAMRSLISTYLNLYADHNHTECMRFCNANLYSAYVVNRQEGRYWESSPARNNPSLQTQLYIHFSSTMVSVYEEKYSYDWNLFVSDIGGSVQNSFDGYSLVPSFRPQIDVANTNNLTPNLDLSLFIMMLKLVLVAPLVKLIRDLADIKYDGFLLGLSVIGLMNIVGKAWMTILMPATKTKHDETTKEDLEQTKKSDETTTDYLQKCEEWKHKNLKLNNNIAYVS